MSWDEDDESRSSGGYSSTDSDTRSVSSRLVVVVV